MKRTARTMVFVVAGALTCPAWPAWSQLPEPLQWNVASGNYTTASNWDPALEPDSFSEATIGNGGTAVIGSETSLGSPALAYQLQIGTEAGSGTVQIMADSALEVADRLFVGYTGVGLLEQTGGLVSVEQGEQDLHIGNELGSEGTYNLVGGELAVADDILVGHLGSGVFNISGGTVTRSGWLVLGDEDPEQTGGAPAHGTLTMTGGEFTQEFGDFEVGDEGIGVANLSGGVMTIAGVTGIGNRPLGTGTLNLTGDIELDTNNLSVGRRGEGTLHVTGAGPQITVSEQFAMQDEPGATATWVAEIAPDGIRLIDVGNDAILAGTLDMELADGFVPSSGQTFDLLTAALGITDNGLELADDDLDDWSLDITNNTLQVTFTGAAAGALQAGDADMDFDFDQLDIIQVQLAGKYLTGQPATWGEGDWNGAPGGSPGNPPIGNQRFDQVDIVAALTTGLYLQGPYGAQGTSAVDVLTETSDLAGASPVPEPPAVVLVLFGLVLAGRGFAQRRHGYFPSS